jgi:Asp-tRNA(Asn)/Glu-tRNA(Gln) amidotransferase A subunit family amidase
MKKVFTILLLIPLCLSAQNVINKQTIKEAEKIIGLEFTESERDSMIEALNEQFGYYKAVREFNLSNSVVPTVIFNPIPTGFVFSEKQVKINYADYSKTKKPASSDELAYYSIGQLAHLIKTKQISSVELTKLYLERLKKYSPKLESVITLTEELAFQQAKRADDELAKGKYRGMLHGIPYGVKDLLATKNYPTTWGAAPYKDQVIDEDATVVKKLEEAGAVLLAKFTMGELAWGDIWFGGKTRNPWNYEEGSSGSSAGSASSVSAGLVPFAIGTETWGSIVSPSTVCGVTGLRPSYGRVSRSGAMALSWSMDKIGTICRNAEDLAIVFDVIRGLDPNDLTLYDYPFNYDHKIDFKKLKIGYLKEDFDKNYPFHSNDSLVLTQLKKLGAELIPISLPKINVNSLSFILSAESAAAFDDLTRSNKDEELVRQIKNAWPNLFRANRFIPAVEYINANRIRTVLINEMNQIMNKIDFYLAPSWEGDNLLLTNLTGHPSVVVPTGKAPDGTNSSITFIGRLFEEGNIIAAAKAFQDATEYHLKRPMLVE